MSNHNDDRAADSAAAQSREGLLDSVAGKAKEVAGAVTGQDALVEEGQLQQAEARRRKAAVADEAVAEAKQQEAVEELRRTDSEVTAEEDAARARAEQVEAVTDRERQAEHLAAEHEAERQRAQGRLEAERHAEELAESRLRDAESMQTEATVTELRTAADQARLQDEADAAEAQAAQLRAQTQN